MMQSTQTDLITNSSLFDEKTFYGAFTSDLLRANQEVIIESPYITKERMKYFHPILSRLLENGVKIYIFTRNPKEHDLVMAIQAEPEIQNFELLGIQTFICTGNHHRKLAIIDRKILWEGSLNILSQNYSREIMRRIEEEKVTLEMFEFLKFQRFI